jgi:hypothetical protein
MECIEGKRNYVKYSQVKLSNLFVEMCVLSLIYSKTALCRFCAVGSVIIICFFCYFIYSYVAVCMFRAVRCVIIICSLNFDQQVLQPQVTLYSGLQYFSTLFLNRHDFPKKHFLSQNVF